MTRFAWFAIVTFLLLTARVASGAAEADDESRKAGPEGFVSLMPSTNFRSWKGVIGNPTIRARMSRRRLARLQRLADEDMRVHWKVHNEIL